LVFTGADALPYLLKSSKGEQSCLIRIRRNWPRLWPSPVSVSHLSLPLRRNAGQVAQKAVVQGQVAQRQVLPAQVVSRQTRPPHRVRPFTIITIMAALLLPFPSGGGSSGPSYYGGGADLSGMINPSMALTQSAHQSIENQNYAVSSYYQNKKVHDQWQQQQNDKGRVTESEAEFFAKELEPGRLSAAQFDRSIKVIHWPPLLRDKQFSKVRLNLDLLFHNRTPDNSGADSDNYNEIKTNCDAMHEILKGMIKELAMPEYVAANHFIKSVSYEGMFAAQ